MINKDRAKPKHRDVKCPQTSRDLNLRSLYNNNRELGWKYWQGPVAKDFVYARLKCFKITLTIWRNIKEFLSKMCLGKINLETAWQLNWSIKREFRKLLCLCAKIKLISHEDRK